MISNKCLASGLGHDFVTIHRDHGGVEESWMECYECKLNIIELEHQEENCEHKMKCIKCGFPMMKDRLTTLPSDEVCYNKNNESNP